MTDEAKNKREPKDGMPRGPLGDARPDASGNASPTPGGQPPEKVEDRPNIGTVKPEDYPTQQ